METPPIEDFHVMFYKVHMVRLLVLVYRLNGDLVCYMMCVQITLESRWLKDLRCKYV